MEISSTLFQSHFRNSNHLIEKFASTLGPELVLEVIGQLRICFRQRIFTPFVTCFACLGQVFNDDSSYKRALLDVACSMPKKKCSASTGGLVSGKRRLPIDFFRLLALRLGSQVDDLASAAWQWRHGSVKVVDGSCISMADTPKNLSKFSRPNKEKVGYPSARITCLFSLATGSLIDLVIAPYSGKGTGETSAMAKLWQALQPGETLLGDSLFSSFGILASAVGRGIHVVTELPKRSHGRVNKKWIDQIIKLPKPKERPLWIPVKAWNNLPAFLEVRIIKVHCAPAGFRTRTKFLLTTHLSSTVTSDDIAEVYRQRWQVELNFRSIKTILGLDFVRAKSPDMVSKDIWLHMLGYNLIRLFMAQAGRMYSKSPLTLSFRTAEQAVGHLRTIAAGQLDITAVLTILLRHIGESEVGRRPNRYEPRAVKTRLKRYALLKTKRSLAKAKLHKKYRKKLALI